MPLSYKKIEVYLFCFFLFSVPFQIRKILYYPGWMFNEWQAVVVYGTDILIALLLLLWAAKGYNFLIFNFQFTKSIQWQIFKNPDFYLVLFVIISAISIKNSSAFYLSFYSLLKLIEFVLLYLYIKYYAIYRFDHFWSLLVLIWGGVFQAGVAVAQFIRQESLGLWFFGESVLSHEIRGVAVFLNEYGERVVRAYGTTPHPNVLAGFLLLVLFAFCAAYFFFRKKISAGLLNIPISLVYGLLLFGFYLTFSRTVIFIGGVSLGVGLLWIFKEYKEKRKSVVGFIVMTLIISGVFLALFWPEVSSRLKLNADDEAVTMRIFYNKESLKSGFNLFGIGTGNFVNWLMENSRSLSYWIYQPVHNIYLLIYSETGILGIGAFILFLLFSFRRAVLKHNPYFIILAYSLLLVGLFDHFLWTLQQGRIVFWLALAGLTFSKSRDTI